MTTTTNPPIRSQPIVAQGSGLVEMPWYLYFQNLSGATSGGMGGGGTVTGVTLSGGSTGLTVNNPTVTSSGTMTLTGDLVVGAGGTGLQGGTPGGILAFTGTQTIVSSVSLTRDALVTGGGITSAPVTLASLGTVTSVLHGNAGGQPTFSSVRLSADIVGNLFVSNLAGGSGASASTFWRGDGTWAGTGAGTVTNIVVVGSSGITVTGSPISSAGTITLSLSAITPVSINFGQSTLNYYGEGTWTPIDSSGAGLTFTNPTGTYERIGRQFTARFALQYPITVDASNTLIGGLPFTVSNNEESRQGFITISNLSVAASPVPNANSTAFRLQNQQTTVVFTNAQASAIIFYGAVPSRV